MNEREEKNEIHPQTSWTKPRIVALLLTVFNIVSLPFLNKSNTPYTPTNPPAYLTLSSLSRPAQFPSLDTLNYTSTPFVNNRQYIFPLGLGQVSEWDKNWKSEEDVNWKWTKFGGLGREDRRFLITEGVRLSSFPFFLKLNVLLHLIDHIDSPVQNSRLECQIMHATILPLSREGICPFLPHKQYHFTHIFTRHKPVWYPLLGPSPLHQGRFEFETRNHDYRPPTAHYPLYSLLIPYLQFQTTPTESRVR